MKKDDSGIYATFWAGFLPEHEPLKVGDFIKAKFDYPLAIRQYEMLYIQKSSSEEIPEAIDYFHSDLLGFAEALLNGPVGLFAFGAICAAYIAHDTRRPDTLQRIQRFFDRMEKELDAVSRFQTETIEFEAYYCAARMLPFESPISRQLHEKTHSILENLLCINEDLHRELFIACSANAHHFVCGDSLLSAHFSSAMWSFDEANRAETAAGQAILENVTHQVAICANLAAQLPEHSRLTGQILHQWETSWDALRYLDEEVALDGLRACSKACSESGKLINQSFAARVQKKLRSYVSTDKKPALPDTVLNPFPDRPNNRERLKGTTAMTAISGHIASLG